MNKDELTEVLRLHTAWLKKEDGGKRADLIGANLFGADLIGADLREADLREADLRGADLREADLRGADLFGADLRRANLREADLRRADLIGADLIGANLRNADLRGADLRRADLRRADCDYSCWPLWCGSKKVKVNMRLVRQLLAHVACLECDDPAFDEIKKAIMPEAQKSHRAGDLGLLNDQKEERK